MERAGLAIRGKYGLFLRQWPSNWEMSPFTIEGVTFNCVEQWMMHQKALCFYDLETAMAVLQAATPREQKELGRKVRGYDDAKWAAVRYDVVLKGTLEKYRQNPALMELLLATGDLELVEAASYDTIWGIGLDAKDSRAGDPTQWRGQNLLGKAVTEARAILRRELELQP